MVKRLMFIVVNVFCFLVIQSVYGLEQEKEKTIKQLTEVMVTGCSLGQKIDVVIEADGKLSFLIEKGAKGSFKGSKSEIPSIIAFLLKEDAKVIQADKTRECMQRYMDKIFDAVLAAPKSSPVPPVLPAPTNRFSLRFIGFYPYGAIKFQPTSDGLKFQVKGENSSYSGYTKASPIDIGNKRTLMVKVKNSNDSVFSNMNKMLKVIVGINDLGLRTIAEEYLTDDPEFIIKADGEFAYTIPNDVVKDGKIQKIGFVFGPGDIKNVEIEAWFQ